MIKQKITVDLNHRSYEIIIGQNILSQINNQISQYSKIFIIIDENVAKIYQPKIASNFSKLKQQIYFISNPSGEQAKSFTNFEKKCEEILAQNIDRKSLLIAFGGGVVGDLCGFLASVLLRGIDFMQVPTTLLSMVDSSVGGKTAINSRLGKNLIGTFYQPKLVLCDTSFLQSLTQRQFISGYAEIVKYGLIKDASFFKFLEENQTKILHKDYNIIQRIIKKSCEIKAQIVANDETESGVRALLNFGHTIGHALEAKCQYSDLCYHGEAVAIGMFLAAKISKNLALIDKDIAEVINDHFLKFGFNIKKKLTEINNLPWSKNMTLLQQLYKDKKTEKGNLAFILLEDLGKAIIKKNIKEEEVAKVITIE